MTNGSPFDNNLGPSYEDAMTVLTTIANAQPAEQAAFIKNIQNTPMGDYLNTVSEFVKNPTQEQPK